MEVSEELQEDTKYEELESEMKNYMFLRRSFSNNISNIRRFLEEDVDALEGADSERMNEFHVELTSIYDFTRAYKEVEDKDESMNLKMEEEILPRLMELLNHPPFIKGPVIIKSLFLNMFSELDAFIGELIEISIIRKPELLNLSARQYDANEVLKYDTIEEFRHNLIQDEIDSIRRESYIEQFNRLESLFSIKTLKAFDNWAEFVETTQRRNIVMHCNSIVSKQYKSICEENGCYNQEHSIGKRIAIDKEYAIKATNVIEEIAMKLIHVIWRKLFINELKFSDEDLTSYVYELLVSRNWNLAYTMSKFAYNQKKVFSAERHMYNLVNYCIALKNMGDASEMNRIIEGTDFSAMKEEFQLARAVLKDDYEDAYKLMESIGHNSSIFDAQSYLKYPLFYELRQQEGFKPVYSKIFNLSEDMSNLLSCQ